jgi:hypothetical protein
MTLEEQAIWSQAAMNTLGQSISLTISDEDTVQEMEMQRSLLLHIAHLRALRGEIREKIREKQHALTRLWPMAEPKSDLIITNRHQATQAAKFRKIYFMCGWWDENVKFLLIFGTKVKSSQNYPNNIIIDHLP